MACARLHSITLQVIKILAIAPLHFLVLPRIGWYYHPAVMVNAPQASHFSDHENDCRQVIHHMARRSLCQPDIGLTSYSSALSDFEGRLRPIFTSIPHAELPRFRLPKVGWADLFSGALITPEAGNYILDDLRS